jgi:hypothetical protein
MSRILVAIKAFFAALASAQSARRIADALAGPALPKRDTDAKEPQRATPPAAARTPSRSEAVTLLATLQREGRFVDLVKQPLAEFTDEQIGAAARNVLRDCSGVLDRLFELSPVVSQDEGTSCEVPRGYDPAKYKLAGATAGQGPFRGQLVHHGWQATQVKLPTWNGSPEGALIIAPAEIDLLTPGS